MATIKGRIPGCMVIPAERCAGGDDAVSGVEAAAGGTTVTGAGTVEAGIEPSPVNAATAASLSTRDAGAAVSFPVRMSIGDNVGVSCTMTNDADPGLEVEDASVEGSAGTVDADGPEETAAEDAEMDVPSRSSGQTMTKREILPMFSTRGGNAATGPDKSKTIRTVPGTGCPVRTEWTTPATPGNTIPFCRVDSGKSTTSRSGFDSDKVLKLPAPCSRISAWVPAAPLLKLISCTSPANAEDGTIPAMAQTNHSIAKPTIDRILHIDIYVGFKHCPIRNARTFSLDNPWSATHFSP
jgi:hypothetical protein